MRHRPLFASLSLFLLFPLPSSAQSPSPQKPAPPVMQSAYGQKLSVPGVPNAGKINDRFYRGAQPAAQAFAELKKLGVTTVVDLRSEDRKTIDWERQQAESQGM